MAERTPRTREYVDRDGVRTTEPTGIRAGVWLLALAIALVTVALFVVVRPALQPAPPPAVEKRASDLARSAAPRSVTAGPLKVTARTQAGVSPPGGLDSQSRGEQKPPPARQQSGAQPEEAQAGAREADEEQTGNEPTGIALFPPPGTKPIKRGIIVPNDFALPPGYVRHYQTTDDGHQLPPILMFHPDYQPVDDRGEPIPLPEDRVVPPEMAPPGLSVQVLEVPQPGEPVSAVPEAAAPARNR